MARKKREWYPGQIMHVMNRGGSHKDIFKEKMDYEYFLMLLKDCRKRYACIIHAYCLMTNHYHLLLETSDKEI